MIQREWMNNGSMRICFFLLIYILSLSSSFHFVDSSLDLHRHQSISTYFISAKSKTAELKTIWVQCNTRDMYWFVGWFFLCFFCIRAKRHQYLNLNVHNNNCFCNMPVHGRTRADYPMPNMYVVHIQALILTQLYFCRCC